MSPSLSRSCIFLPSSYCHLHHVAKVTPVPLCFLLKSPRTTAIYCCWRVQSFPLWPQQAPACANCSSWSWAATEFEYGKPLPRDSPVISWFNSKLPWIFNKKSPRICLSPPNSHTGWWDLTPTFASINLKDSLDFSENAPDTHCYNSLGHGMACQKTQVWVLKDIC